MMSTRAKSSLDWVGGVHTHVLAWGIPYCAIAAGLFVEVPARAVIWTIALAWMGTACILNARRCGRTHCQFTGPYYLGMIVPVGVLGLGIVSAGFAGWLALGANCLRQQDNLVGDRAGVGQVLIAATRSRMRYTRSAGVATMDPNTKLIGTGVAGALGSMLCCVTPVLVVLLGALGLTAWVAKLDYVLIPMFVASIGLVIFAVVRRKRACPAKTPQFP